jgi:TerC family integral membrane protein
MIHPTLEIAIGSPELWAISIAAVLVLFGLDFLITRKPHEVSMKEAIGWSAFYIALPLAFGVWIWQAFGSQRGVEFYAGYLVEKSLSVDNLFVFMLLLSSFAVPRELQQRVLLIGVAGALVLRGVFIALGAAMLANFAWTFLLFGLILLATAVKVLRDTLNPAEHEIHPNDLRIVKLARRFFPVSDGYRGTRMSVREDGRRVITPLALATLAILATDVVFAVDSVPAVYGITGDAYLVFVTNAFALLGLRQMNAGAGEKTAHRRMRLIRDNGLPAIVLGQESLHLKAHGFITARGLGHERGLLFTRLFAGREENFFDLVVLF